MVSGDAVGFCVVVTVLVVDDSTVASGALAMGGVFSPSVAGDTAGDSGVTALIADDLTIASGAFTAGGVEMTGAVSDFGGAGGVSTATFGKPGGAVGDSVKAGNALEMVEGVSIGVG